MITGHTAAGQDESLRQLLATWRERAAGGRPDKSLARGMWVEGIGECADELAALLDGLAAAPADNTAGHATVGGVVLREQTAHQLGLTGGDDTYRSGPADDMAAVDPVNDAADLLFAMRHHLPPDVMRTLADTWTCASAARHGEPAERFWEADDVRDPFADHDTDQCETENHVSAPTDDTAPGLTRVLLHLEKARDDAERDDNGHMREAFDEAIDYVRDELSRGPSGPLTRYDNEWCVFYGGPEPDACAGLEVTGQADAEEASQWLIESGVAVRRVYRSPWQVRPQCSSCTAVLDGQNDCCDARIAEIRTLTAVFRGGDQL